MQPLQSKRIDAPPAYEATKRPSAPKFNDWNSPIMDIMPTQPVRWEGSTMYMLNKKTNLSKPRASVLNRVFYKILYPRVTYAKNIEYDTNIAK